MATRKKESGKTEEFRRDLVSRDWILISSARGKRPNFFKKAKGKKVLISKKDCPFEQPQKSGNLRPVLWYPRPGKEKQELHFEKDWFVQSVPNKFPLLGRGQGDPKLEKSGIYDRIDAVGYHEVIITRDHDRPFEKMTIDEIATVFKLYRQRFKMLEQDSAVDYVLIYHNQGELAGASVPHPHSQLVALPIVPPDVSKSINGGIDYYERNGQCAHCEMLKKDIKDKTRIVLKNKYFISVAPYAPRVPFETRIYPVAHSSDFEEISDEVLYDLAKVFKEVLWKLSKVLKNPDYNFFIHTSSVRVKKVPYYHWHMEILPRTYKWAGLELGTGVEVISVSPEESAKQLRKAVK